MNPTQGSWKAKPRPKNFLELNDAQREDLDKIDYQERTSQRLQPEESRILKAKEGHTEKVLQSLSEDKIESYQGRHMPVDEVT